MVFPTNKRIFYRIFYYISSFISKIISIFVRSKRGSLQPITDQILITPASILSQQIKSGQLKSESVVKCFIERVKLVNPLLNAVVDNRFEKALVEARNIDKKLEDARNNSGDKSLLELPLIGIPISIKEHLSVEGCSHTGGLKSERLTKATKNALVVDLLIKNGLIPFVLTNIPEMSMWWDAKNPVYGRTNNPHDFSRIPGGSSGGEGALLASAGSVVGIGTDLAGSIRMPCYFCGIFGHKPTPFVVSIDGMIPNMQNDREKLIGLGPMTRYACDLKPMLKILASNNSDKLQLDKPFDLNELKIYYLFDLNDPLAAECNSDVLDIIGRAIDYLVNKYHVDAKQIKFDAFKHGWFIWSVEAYGKEDLPPISSLFTGRNKSGQMNCCKEMVKKMFGKSEHGFNAIMMVLFDKFNPTYGSNEHIKLTKEAADLRKQFNELLGDNGIILMPTHPESAPKHNTTSFKIFNTAYTCLPNILQCPITQCPLGFAKDGLPIGVQILAKPFNDRLTIAVSEELEKVFGGWSKPCEIRL